MPIKFKPSQTIRLKATSKNSTEHFYMKSTETSTLQTAYDNGNTTPKSRQKIRNELTKRGIM